MTLGAGAGVPFETAARRRGLTRLQAGPGKGAVFRLCRRLMGPWAAEGTTLPYVTGLARNGTNIGTAFLAVMRRSAQGGRSKLVI